MLDKKVFKKGISKLLVVFPNWSIKCEDSEAMAVWYEFFKGNTNNEFNGLIDRYIENEKSYPTIAGLKFYFRKEHKTGNIVILERE